MRLLVVSATSLEISPLVAKLALVSNVSARLTRYASSRNEVDVLVTGVGMVATATWLARTLAVNAYDAAINFGVCGSFDRALAIGTVVQVLTDRIADLGAEDGDRFLSIHELGLLGENDFPFVEGRLVSPALPAVEGLRLTGVNAVTVDTAHGNEASIAKLVARCNPQVESMEGAAFFYGCLTGSIPCAQIRAVSNFIERRNREAWNIPLAVRNLNEAAIALVERL